MKGKDLHIFLIILIISTVLGWFIIDCTFNLYSDLVTFLSIVIGFEITSLSIVFNSPLKKKLYDKEVDKYGSELHRLRDYYKFSIYVGLISVLMIFIIPEFCVCINNKFEISKFIIVVPILSCSAFCLIKTCNNLFRIFVFPTNE